MPSYRKGRINEAIANELCVALREARDPVIVEAFVSVTRAEAAPDLKIAKIYFSHLAGEEKEVKKAGKNQANPARLSALSEKCISVLQAMMIWRSFCARLCRWRSRAT